MSGGGGSDIFKFNDNDGRDQIKDFAPGVDMIQLVDEDGNPATADDIADVVHEDNVRENDDGYYTYNWENTTFTVNEVLKATDFYKGPEPRPFYLGDDGETWPGTGVDNSGDDTVYGGDGDDTIMGGPGDDELWGFDGNDNLMGGPGNDYLSGRDGDDMLTGGAGNDELQGGAGNDTFKFDKDDGDNRIYNFRPGDKIMLGDDPLTAEQVAMVLGTKEQGVVSGFAYTWGDTTFTVDNELDEDAFVMAAAPPDPEPIELGDDGETWPDDDDPEGHNDGADTVHGGDGDDMIDGGRKNDTLKGMGGDDTLEGGSGNDMLEGGDDDDMLKGESGMDTLKGGSGMDELMGGSGDDYLSGGSGADDLTGGDGNDTLMGGTGNDTFKFDKDDGVNEIVDFDKGRDKIMLGDDDLTSTEVTEVLADENVERSADDGYIYEWGETTFEVSEDAKLEASDFVMEDDKPEPPADNVFRLGATDEDWPPEGVDNSKNDKVYGNDLDNEIMGGGGHDTLMGGDGADLLVGGAGNDELDGGGNRGGDGRDEHHVRHVARRRRQRHPEGRIRCRSQRH